MKHIKIQVSFVFLVLIQIVFLGATSSAHAQSLTTGLMAHYKLDEASGTTTSDSSGKGNNGTATGAAWVSGKIGNAVSLNGTSSNVVIPRINSDEISVSAWIKRNRGITDTTYDSIFGAYYWNSDAQKTEGFNIRFGGTSPYNQLDFILVTKNSSGSRTQRTASYTLSDSNNVWHHIIATYSKVSGAQKLYVDGVVRSTASHPANNTIVMLSSYANMYLGYSNVNSAYFPGLIDEVRVYNRALSDSEVVDLYNYNLAPRATTDIATSTSSSSAVLNAKVHPNDLSTSVYFQYGLSSGSYTKSTTLQTISGSMQQAVSATISGLTYGTTYYYRAVATNSSGVTNGTEKFFIVDTEKPSGSIQINMNTASTDSEFVYLSLSATDNNKVLGYYISNSSTPPTAGTVAWKEMTFDSKSASYVANGYYSLSSGDGSKTVYAWFIDAGGNISSTTSDSISLAKNDSWKNWYGIAWRDTPSSNAKYAKQVGHDFVAVMGKPDKVQANNYSGLSFYITDPQIEVIDHFARNGQPAVSSIKIGNTYSQAQIAWIVDNMAWKATTAENQQVKFPDDLATGWWYEDPTLRYDIRWDFQQQRVIDMVVEGIIAMVKSYHDPILPFTFEGYLYDWPGGLTGDFNYWNGKNNRVTISKWTGVDSSVIHKKGDGSGLISHEYASFAEGTAAFYKKLHKRTKEEFPNSKWAINPWKLYNSAPVGEHEVAGEWIYQIRNRADKDEFTPHMLLQESAGSEFVDEPGNFSSGVDVTRDRVGTSQQAKLGEYENRLYAAKAAANGSWYHWFGYYGGEEAGSKSFNSIAEVYPRLKLIRLIPSWDNMRKIPLAQREWNNNETDPVYRSYEDAAKTKLRSYIDANVMYSRHWKTGKLFAVFNTNTTSAVVKLNLGESVATIRCVDGYFIETTDCSSHFNITDTANVKELRLKSSVTIPIDTTNGQVKGSGYIFAINSSDVTAPAAPTNLRVLP